MKTNLNVLVQDNHRSHTVEKEGFLSGPRWSRVMDPGG